MKFPQHILDENPGLASVQKFARLGNSGYRSNLEERAATEWVQFAFKWWMYEPFKLSFPGGSFYTPDFFGELHNGKLAVIEVKGFNRNLRADKLKFKACCEVHEKWLIFCWLTWDKVDGWTEKWYDRQS